MEVHGIGLVEEEREREKQKRNWCKWKGRQRRGVTREGGRLVAAAVATKTIRWSSTATASADSNSYGHATPAIVSVLSFLDHMISTCVSTLGHLYCSGLVVEPSVDRPRASLPLRSQC
ncbi:hypothetical protein RIF29_38046 [Crotalaria pallida]|uniref:Uncharacterized protein n=1 Tax=Crotalaria pallida TaxID=3830 RepID=A0AAN9HNE8_CROPI